MNSRLARNPCIESKLKRLLLMLCIMSPLGCVAPYPDKTEDSSSLTRAPANLSPWTASGKMAITEGEETHTARFRWQRHDLTRDTVTVTGPFSMNRIVLEREGAKLIWRDGEEIRPLSDIATLAPPLHLLARDQPDIIGQWLLGYPGNPEHGQIEVLSWQTVSPWTLPEQMTVVGEGYSVKIRVSTWDIGAQ